MRCLFLIVVLAVLVNEAVQTTGAVETSSQSVEASSKVYPKPVVVSRGRRLQLLPFGPLLGSGGTWGVQTGNRPPLDGNQADEAPSTAPPPQSDPAPTPPEQAMPSPAGRNEARMPPNKDQQSPAPPRSPAGEGTSHQRPVSTASSNTSSSATTTTTSSATTKSTSSSSSGSSFQVPPGLVPWAGLGTPHQRAAPAPSSDSSSGSPVVASPGATSTPSAAAAWALPSSLTIYQHIPVVSSASAAGDKDKIPSLGETAASLAQAGLMAVTSSRGISTPTSQMTTATGQITAGGVAGRQGKSNLRQAQASRSAMVTLRATASGRVSKPAQRGASHSAAVNKGAPQQRRQRLPRRMLLLC